MPALRYGLRPISLNLIRAVEYCHCTGKMVRLWRDPTPCVDGVDHDREECDVGGSGGEEAAAGDCVDHEVFAGLRKCERFEGLY